MTDVLCPLEHHLDPDRPRWAEDGAYLCAGHCRAVAQALASLAVDYEELDYVLVRAGVGEHVSGGRYAEDGSANAHLDEAVMQARGDALACARSWAQVVVEDRGVTVPGDGIGALAAFLTVHGRWLVSQPFADEFAVKMLGVSRDLRRLVQASTVRCFPIGACLDCGGTMVARLRDTADLLPSAIECDTCGLAVTAGAWVTYGRRLRRVGRCMT